MGGIFVVTTLRNIVPLPTQKPDVNELDADELLLVKQAYLDMKIERGWPDDMTTDNIRVLEYCGTYRGCVAVMLTDNQTFYAAAIGTETVAGVPIMYSNSNRIYVCKDGAMYTLEEAYAERMLRRSDIRKIRDAHYQY
jgi:hypothetical protein